MWWMLIIPVVTIIGLYVICPHRMAWWEYMIPAGSTIVSIMLVNAVCDYAMSSDEEFHGGWVTHAIWDEHWTEQYTTTETYRDSNGKSRTKIVTKTRYHGDHYYAYDSNGYSVAINYAHFMSLAGRFGNNVKSKPWHSGQISWGDGRRFTTTWQNNNDAFTPCFTSHNYKNRVAKSHSIFNFKDIDDKTKQSYGLYDYPKIYNYHYQNSILGINNSSAEHKLTEANARLGRMKQLRIFILIFHNQPIDAGLTQQQYWKNGNKNEIVVCIGEKNKQLDWAFAFGWDNERLLVDLREDIIQQGSMDVDKIVATTIKLTSEKFHRKKFKDFEYIKLEPPVWAYVISFVFVMIVNGMVVYVVVMNDQNACSI